MFNRIVVMGVSGSGKSTLAAALASLFGLAFIEGDSLHAEASIDKMAAGTAVGDEDRCPWLHRIAAAMEAASDTGPGAVATCSALRRAYRQRLRALLGPDLRFVMIDLPRAELERRMVDRPGHFMPLALLDSQLLALERPEREPDALILDGHQPIEDLLDAARCWLAGI